MRDALFVIVILLLLMIAVLWPRDDDVQDAVPPTSTTSYFATDSSLETLASGLDTPWEIEPLPDGTLLVTERPGTLRAVSAEQELATPIEVPDVAETGEGGLLGLALHPDYPSNGFIYIYHTSEESGSNRIVRYQFDGRSLVDASIILDDIPAGPVHNGGRLAFGPDRLLYVTTGDAGDDDTAQDTDSLAGKILRLNDDGSVPSGNPFGNAVYAYGFRNPQGITWDDAGGLWAIDHGRSGAQSGYDEINYVEAGGNYGWPVIQGYETQAGMRAPILNSGPTVTWAPADLAHQDGVLYMTGLRGQALYQVPVISPGSLGSVTEHLKGRFGRLRAITFSNEGDVAYLSTSNRDGRGNPVEGDDRILRTGTP